MQLNTTVSECATAQVHFLQVPVEASVRHQHGPNTRWCELNYRLPLVRLSVVSIIPKRYHQNCASITYVPLHYVGCLTKHYNLCILQQTPRLA